MDGTCRYSILDAATGESFVDYAGYWSVYEEELYLSLSQESGEHPENPELDYLYGGYLTEGGFAEELTLTFENGCILTLGMEEYGFQPFRFMHPD